jgi:SAM-dependent methyltransferase
MMSSMRTTVQWVYNSAFDSFYGVSTLETPSTRSAVASEHGDQHRYVPTDYLALLYLFTPLRLRHEDVLFDIGCGLGRAVVVAAHRRIRGVVGIEYDPQLAAAAQRNACRLRWEHAPIDIRNDDAAQADYDEGTVFWMYHPFGAQTMSRVLDRLHGSLRAAPRWMRIGYVNPILGSLLDAQTWLRRTGERRFPGAGESGHAIYWEAGPNS